MRTTPKCHDDDFCKDEIFGEIITTIDVRAIFFLRNYSRVIDAKMPAITALSKQLDQLSVTELQE